VLFAFKLFKNTCHVERSEASSSICYAVMHGLENSSLRLE